MPEEIEGLGKPVNLGGVVQGLPVYQPVNPNLGNNTVPSANRSFDDMYSNAVSNIKPKGADYIDAGDIDLSGRTKYYYQGRDNEEIAAQQQSTWSKWGNGFAKMAGTAGSTFLSDTVGLVAGIGSMIKDGRFASLYDNPVNNSLDKFNKEMENYLPNYYTHAETDASWYSPDNILTANFFSDKVIKNLGFSIGSMAGGFAWGAAFKAIGLTNKLVQAGKGLETVTAVENAIATAPKIGRYGAITNSLEGLSNQFLRKTGATLLNNSERGIISVMGTMGEASIESLQNLNETRDNMIKSYVQTYGRPPEGTDLDELNAYAEKVGNFTWGMNVALLSATNYIQLPKIMNASKTLEKREMNEIAKEAIEQGTVIADRVGAKYVAAPAMLEKFAGRPGKLFDKYVVKPAGLLFAPAEAFEEGSQFAIQTGTQSYFQKAYDTNTNITDFWTNLTESMGNVLSDGVTKALTTKEGLESMLIGGLSGGLQTSFSPFGANTIKERGIFGDGGFKGANTQLAIDALNNSKNLNDVLKDGVKYANIAINSQTARQQDIANDDTFSEKNHEKDYALAYIMPRAKYGKIDSVKEEVNQYKQQAMSDQGFKELANSGVVNQGESREQFVARLDNILETADQVSKTYDMFNDKYSAIADDKGKRVYSDATIEKMVYASAKVLDFDKRSLEMQVKLAGTPGIDILGFLNVVKNSKAWNNGDYKNIQNEPEVDEFIKQTLDLIKDDELLNAEDVRKDFIDFAEITATRKSFIDEFNDIKKNPLKQDVLDAVNRIELQKRQEVVAREEEDKGVPIEQLQQEFDTDKVTKKESYDKEREKINKELETKNADSERQAKYDARQKELEQSFEEAPKLSNIKENQIVTRNGVEGRIVYDDEAGYQFNPLGTNQYFDLGTKEDLPLYELGIKESKLPAPIENIDVTANGEFLDITINGKSYQNLYSNPMSAINYDKDGNIISVTLTGEKGNVTFKKYAEEIAYSILLHTYQKLNDENQRAAEEFAKRINQPESEGKKPEATSADTAESQRVEEELDQAIGIEEDREVEELIYAESLEELIAAYNNLSPENQEKYKDFFIAAKDHLDIKDKTFINNLSEKQNLSDDMINDVASQLFSTMNQGIQNASTVGVFEAESKKSNEIVGNATAGPSERSFTQTGEVVSDHHARADKFGINLPNLPNQSSIKGVVVTAATEGGIIPGLANFLKQGKDFVDASTTISLVMAIPSQDGKSYTLVNEKGEEIAKQQPGESDVDYANRLHSSAIFQTFPSNLDRFIRDSTSIEERANLNANYNKWRTETLNSNNTPNYNIQASLGTFDRVKKEDGITSVAVEDSNLIDPKDLTGKRLIYVPTVEDTITLGSTSFTRALGKPFLILNNAYVALKNKLHSPKEASAIYDVLHRLSSIIVEENAKGGFAINNSPEAVRLIDWLRSVTYWGTPKAGVASLNSIWFDKTPTGFKLLMSGKTDEKGNYVAVSEFSPIELDKNKDAILANLAKMYNNVNAKKTDDAYYNERYEQIISISRTGEIESKVWPNYQSYLLSNKSADNGPRESEDIPLTTNIRPITSAEDTNRHGVYFIIDKNDVDKQSTDIAPTGKAITITAPGIKKEEAPKEEAPAVEVPKGKFVLDGETSNTIPLQNGPVTFIYDEKKPGILTSLELDPKVSQAYIPNIKQEIIDKFIADRLAEGETVSVQDAIDRLTSSAFGTYVLNQIKLDQEAVAAAKAELLAKQIEEVQAPTLSPELEAKKEEIINSWAYDSMANDQEWSERALSAAEDGEDINSPESREEAEEWAEFGSPYERSVKAINDKYEKLLADLEAGATTTEEVSATITPKVSDIEKLISKIFEVTDEDNPLYELGFNVLYGKYRETINGKTKQEVIDKINAKYDAELAEVAPTITPEITLTEQEQLDAAWESEEGAPDNPELRVKLEQEMSKFEGEDWNKVEAFLKANFPNIPFYRVKNVLKGTNGLQAWGMLKNGAIYVYENAEVGTAYHEIFEAVWKMFTDPKEQTAIRAEFTNRPGSYVDRVSGNTIKYSEATPQEIKEQLAEEFRDYVKDGVLPTKQKTGKSFIVQLFKDIVDFVKSFFLGTKGLDNTKALFEKIGNGYYKTFVPQESALTYAKAGIIDIDTAAISIGSELSEIPSLTQGQVHDLMQQMTFLTLGYIMRDDQNLFDIPNINKSTVYAQVQANLRKTFKGVTDATSRIARESEGRITKESADAKNATVRSLYNSVLLNWEALVDTHTVYLKKYDVEFDENDEIGLTNENSTGKGEYDSSDKIDHFRKLNSAVKLVLSTLPIMDVKGKPQISSVYGKLLVPTSEAWVSVMNNIHDALNTDDMLNKIKQMAKEDPTYEMLYKRLSKVGSSQAMNWDVLTQNDSNLLAAFTTAFDKSNPDVKILNVLGNGNIQVGEANLTSASRQILSDFENGLRIVINTPNNPYFEYSKSAKAYVTKKDATVSTDKIADKIKFLSSLNIDFNASAVKALEFTNPDLYRKFNVSVKGIESSMKEGKKIATIGGKTLEINKRLLDLANIKAKMENPEFSNTYYGVGGEKIQTFIGTNAGTDLYKNLAAIPTYEALANHPQYSYLYTDSFAQNSVILNAIFNIDKATKTGKRRELTESANYLKTAIANGTIDQVTGKKKESSSLSYKERLVQELNMNLEGFYYNLVAGDASLEHMTFMGNHITVADLTRGNDEVNKIFRGYLVDEINLARENRPVAKGRVSKELRFMSSILGKTLTNKILKSKDSPEKIYADNMEAINLAVNNFLDAQTTKLTDSLISYDVIESLTDQLYKTNNLGFNTDSTISKANLDLNMKALSVNFMINNIEFHKVLYSDPYQYADELKRIKNFLSPRQSIINSSANMNSLFNRVWNEGFKEDDLGYTNFAQDFFRTASLKDIKGVNKSLEEYENWDETDGGGVISFKAHRTFRIRSSNWNANEEAQYRHDVAYEELDKSGATEEELNEFDKKNPQVKSAYTPSKPIVSGNKADGKTYNDVLLDKFALYPLSYRVLKQISKNGGREDSNALALYKKMQSEKLDYVVFESARKVGATFSNDVYNEETGEFNTAPYEGIVNVPFAIMSVQSEVPSKEAAFVTRGTQVTKLVTMDYMEAGVPIDYVVKGVTDFNSRYEAWYKLSEKQREKASPLYKEIKDNQYFLEEMMEVGYQDLLVKLGISDNGDSYDVVDRSVVAKILREEILKREANTNMMDALVDFENGSSTIEATSAYQQVRNILYSLIDKNVLKPKISGSQKVQISSAMFESTRARATTVNGKKGFESDILDFYINEDGKRVCEIMIAPWFKTTMSDVELLEYLNTTDEGQKILAGFAFRTPTQKQNSIDVFKIKQFLPKEFGDSVVIPSALVKKVGSDFDIDKLSIYLKNTFINSDGKLSLVEYKGTKNSTIEYYEKEFDKKLSKNKEKKEAALMAALNDVDTIDTILNTENEEIEDRLLAKNKKLDKLIESFDDDFDDAANFLMQKAASIRESLTKLNAKDVQAEFKKFYVAEKYKQSLENAYIQSLQNLTTHPSNFDKLITPNSAEQLKDLSKKIVRKLGQEEVNYSAVGNMLDRTFMSGLRHAFVTGKYAIGIAAISQTNHSLNQRQPIYIDASKFDALSKQEKFWLTGGTMNKQDLTLKFKDFNKMIIDGKEVVTLSMIRNAERSKEFPNGQYISDINGQFIDGYVDISKGPWIMQLGAKPNVASTWLFLVKAGVPIDTVAYFMNQPIIRDYLQKVENAGYSYLFIEDIVNDVKSDEKYKVSSFEKVQDIKVIPSKTTLFNSIGKDKFNTAERFEQQFMLGEFLKYAKLAENLLSVTQGTNYDTAGLNDPMLVFKKDEQLKKARLSVISSPDKLLNNSFVGKQKVKLEKLRDAIAEILSSDKGNIRAVLQDVLRPYVNLNDRDFLKVARKATNDLFDWAVQVDSSRNTSIQSLLLSDENAAKQVIAFKTDIANDSEHPLYNNHIVGIKGILSGIATNKFGGVNNLSVKNKDNKVYDQDNIIYAFKEMREYLRSIGKLDLYSKIVGVSILQSGLSTTPYSFTSLLPYEDFKDVYSEIITNLDSTGYDYINQFNKLNVLQRNNATDDTIVPQVKAKRGFGAMGPYYNLNMSFKSDALNTAMKNGSLTKMVKISTLANAGSKDVIAYSWEVIPEGKTKAQMMKDGDFSYIQKGLFAKVYHDDNKMNPVIYKEGKYENYVYHMINAWGDGFRANEFYNIMKPSVIENGFIKVENGEWTRDLKFSDGTIITEKGETSPERTNAHVSQFFSKPIKINVSLSDQASAQQMASETKDNSIDLNLRDKYFSTGNVQKTSDILQGIANSNHPLNKVANHLISYAKINNVEITLDDVPFYSNINTNVKRSSGYYSPTENTIHIAEKAFVRNGESETLILHEILHALSSSLIKNSKNSSVGRDFKKLYDQAVISLGKYDPETGKGQYALLDMDEFFVGLFTDSKFIKELSSIQPVDNFKYSNLFEEIVDYILDLLKLGKDSSLYDQSFALATNILDYQKDQVQALYEMAQIDQDYYEDQPMELNSPGGKPGIELTSLTCK